MERIEKMIFFYFVCKILYNIYVCYNDKQVIKLFYNMVGEESNKFIVV